MLSHKDHKDEINMLKLANGYFQKGQLDKTIEECQKLLKSHPEDCGIFELLGDAYAQKNEHSLAFREYSKVAAVLVHQGQTYKTTDIYKKIMGLDPHRLDTEGQNQRNLIQFHLKADEALAENNSEDAIQYLTRILKIDPMDFAVALKLAQLFEVLGRNADAISQYVRMGGVFLKNRQYKKAREVFKQVITLEPQNIGGHIQLGEIYIKLENEFDAKNEYHKAAEIALAKNDLHAAFEYSLKAVELKSMDAYYVLGVVLFERKKWIDAKMKFDDFLRFKPEHVGAHVYLGKVFDAMEQPIKAVESFQKALKMDKYNMMALEVWAEYCGKTKNTAGAIETYNILIEKAFAENQDRLAIEWARLLVAVDETVASSHLKLAEILEKNGDQDAAAEAYFNLYLIYAKENNDAEAEKYRRKTLQMKPLHAKALSLGKKQSVEETPATVSPVVVDPPAAVPLTAGAAFVSVPLSEKVISTPVSSIEPIEEIPSVSPREARLAKISVAEQYVVQGLLNEAIDIFEKLIAANPQDSFVKDKLNKLYLALSQTGANPVQPVEPSYPREKETIVISHFLNQSISPAESRVEQKLKTTVEAFSDAEKKARFEDQKKSKTKLKRKFV